jgi:glycosyltransferase involved in cell wall biosynthesis
LRILHLLAPAQVGGLETVVLNLARAQQQRKKDVLVAPILEPGASSGHAFLQAMDQSGIDRSVISVPGRAYRLERKKVRGLVTKFRPNILHTHGYRPEILHGKPAKAVGVPVLSTSHGLTSETWKVRLYEWLAFRALRQFDAVVAVSKPLGERLVRAGVPEDRVHVVQNASSEDLNLETPEAARAELGLEPGMRPVAWVGRLSEEKGPDVALRAFAGVEEPDAVLVMIGGGPMKNQLESLAAELGLSERVRWSGDLAGAARLLPAFDLLLMSSRTEGTPMVLLEAMATKTPIVCTGVGGIPDIVTDREAIMTEPEDERALALAIDECLRDRIGAEARANSALSVLRERFSVGPWVEEYLRIYESIQP